MTQGSNILLIYDTVILLKAVNGFSTLYSEKAMANNPSTLAWKIPWMAEPGRLLSMGLLSVGHD